MVPTNGSVRKKTTTTDNSNIALIQLRQKNSMFDILRLSSLPFLSPQCTLYSVQCTYPYFQTNKTIDNMQHDARDVCSVCDDSDK